jgi:tetratricopeptide (TPR) repeat protein
MRNNDNSAKTAATHQPPLIEHKIANDDSIILKGMTTPEESIQMQILEGNFHLAVPLLTSILEESPDNKLNLPLYYKRLLLEAGYYSLVTKLTPLDSNSTLTTLAGFISGQRNISESEVRRHINNAQNGFDEAILTAQLCSLGATFGALPKPFLNEALDILSVLAARLEACGDRQNACEAYLRLGSILATNIAKGTTIARTIYRYVKDIAPTQALLNEATLRELEAISLTAPLDRVELIKAIKGLIDGTVAVSNTARLQLILRLAEALIKMGDSGLEYLEYVVNLAQSSGSLSTAFQGLLSILNLLIARGDSYNASRLLISAERLCESMRFPVGLLSCELSRVHILITQGEYDASRATVHKLVKTARSLPGGLGYALAVSFFCDQLGMLPESDSLRDWALKCFKRNGNKALETLALQTKANSQANRGENQKALSSFKKLERLLRARGDEAQAIEAKSLAFQIRLMDISAALGNGPKPRNLSRIINQATKLLEALPQGAGVLLRARLSQIQGQMFFLAKRYTDSQVKLNAARDLFLSVGDSTNSAFVSGFLGLAQLEAAQMGATPRDELLVSAEKNIILAAQTFQEARIRGEAARMWKMAAVVSLELSGGSFKQPVDNSNSDGDRLELKIKAEDYLERAWASLSEHRSLSSMNQEGTGSLSSSERDQLQIIKLGIENAIELSNCIKDSADILEKWRLRSQGEENRVVVQ